MNTAASAKKPPAASPISAAGSPARLSSDPIEPFEASRATPAITSTIPSHPGTRSASPTARRAGS